MSLVGEQTLNITGKSWLRARAIVINNEYNKTPVITWEVEKITQSDDKTYTSVVPSGRMKTILNETTSFPLLDPYTGTEIGSTSGAQLYTILYSLFVNEQKANA